MSLDLVAVANGAAHECVRQQVGLDALARLIDAYDFAYRRRNKLLTYTFVVYLGSFVDPDRGLKFRITPVTFRNGGTSANHQDIFELLNARIYNLTRGECSTEEFINEFLWIHPFEDGNGRVAWILQNFLNGTMDSPYPLKEYRW